MGIPHTTLTRKLQRINKEEIWEALTTTMNTILKIKENLLIIDFTHLDYTGKELLNLTTGTKHGNAFKVLAATNGKFIYYLAPPQC